MRGRSGYWAARAAAPSAGQGEDGGSTSSVTSSSSHITAVTRALRHRPNGPRLSGLRSWVRRTCEEWGDRHAHGQCRRRKLTIRPHMIGLQVRFKRLVGLAAHEHVALRRADNPVFR